MDSPILNNSKKFEPEAFSIAVEDFLIQATKGLSIELLDWMKQKFESNMHHLIGENLGDVTVGVVVDSSSVIRALNYYSKGKTSLLFKLVKNPIFPMYAPPKLEEEVLDYINNKSKNYNKKKLLDGWAQLKTIIIIKKVQNSESIKLAKKIMTRDPNDVSFVSLIIDTGATVILSEDKDYQDSVKQFNIEKLGKVVGVYHKGLFSFFIMTDLIPPVMELAGKLVLSITKILFEFLGIIGSIVKAIVSGSISAITNIFSRMPSWIAGILLAASVLAIIIIIFHDNTRKKVSSKLKPIWNKAKPAIEKIISWLVNCLDKLLIYAEKSSPYLTMSLLAIGELHKNITAFSNEIKNIKLEDAINFS